MANIEEFVQCFETLASENHLPVRARFSTMGDLMAFSKYMDDAGRRFHGCPFVSSFNMFEHDLEGAYISLDKHGNFGWDRLDVDLEEGYEKNYSHTLLFPYIQAACNDDTDIQPSEFDISFMM